MKWGFEFEKIDITQDPLEKFFLKEMGYKTVPQLFYKDLNVNSGKNTIELTKDSIVGRMQEIDRHYT